jgi:hypothetical protein
METEFIKWLIATNTAGWFLWFKELISLNGNNADSELQALRDKYNKEKQD